MRYLPCFALIFCIGCLPLQKKIISGYNSEGFSITSLNKSSARLFVNSNADIYEFDRMFENEYQTRARFDSSVASQLSFYLSKVMTVSKANAAELGKIFVDQSYSDSSMREIKAIFDSAKEDYFLGIKKVVISKIVTTGASLHNEPNVISTPNGPEVLAGGSSGEISSASCIVTARVEVWSVKDRRKLAEFVSIGQSPVTLFDYQSTLRDAIKEAIINIRWYIAVKRTSDWM